MTVNRKAISISMSLCTGALCLMAVGVAQAKPNPKKAFEAGMGCREISDAADRLLCFDKAFENDQAVDQVMSEKEVEIATVIPPTREELVEDFGKETLKKKADKDDKIDSFEAAITNVEKNPFGKLTITLENGQVWRQLDSDKKLMRTTVSRMKTAKIKRAMLGSYKLRIEPLGSTITVRRVE